MDQDPVTPSTADAEYAEAWGEDAMKPATQSEQAKEAAAAAQREQDEFNAAFLAEDEAK